MEEGRLDKWLWAVRIFKTRSIAIDFCKKNRISVNGNVAKPAKMIKKGDKISVRKPPIEYTFEVIEPIQHRVGAKFISEYVNNITDDSQYELIQMQKLSGFIDRAKGSGRPTKKDRRELEQFQEDIPEFSFYFEWEIYN